jgi:DNA-binding transcriptional LysR family regulator
MHKENWDDLRFVLAVADSGTVSEAARLLGVNHATVLRRIAAFEEAQGGQVFDRTMRGYQVRPERARMIEAARDVQLAVHGVGRLMKGAMAPLRGAVRLTATDTFCLAILPDIVARLHDAAPELRIDLHNSNAHADLARLQADLAIRPTRRLADDMVGRCVGDLAFSVYAPVPAVGSDSPPWLGLAGPLGRSVAQEWMAAQVDPALIVAAADSFAVLRELVARGQGQAILPCCLGDGDPRMRRVEDLRASVTVPVWVASHVDLSDSPRIRTLRDRLSDELVSEAHRLAGLD